MDLEIVFNEISLKTPASDIPTARQWMINLINTIRAVKPASGVKRKLRTKSDFQYLLLADDYRVVQWRNDPDVDLEARRFLKVVDVTNPLANDGSFCLCGDMLRATDINRVLRLTVSYYHRVSASIAAGRRLRD